MGNYFAPYSLRIPEELLDKVKHLAAINKRSANKEIEYIIQKHVEQWETENGELEMPDGGVKPGS